MQTELLLSSPQDQTLRSVPRSDNAAPRQQEAEPRAPDRHSLLSVSEENSTKCFKAANTSTSQTGRRLSLWPPSTAPGRTQLCPGSASRLCTSAQVRQPRQESERHPEAHQGTDSAMHSPGSRCCTAGPELFPPSVSRKRTLI